MSPRKLVQTDDALSLPTIKDYFGMMAVEQRDDILRLKKAATVTNPSKSATPPSKGGPDPWLLHPIRRTAGSAAKSGAKSTARSASKKAPRKAAKKVSKKASKKSRR
jgi:hypothetical protein